MFKIDTSVEKKKEKKKGFFFQYAIFNMAVKRIFFVRFALFLIVLLVVVSIKTINIYSSFDTEVTGRERQHERTLIFLTFQKIWNR